MDVGAKFHVKQLVKALTSDNVWHDAVIESVDSMAMEKGECVTKYYVHFLQLDRRYDRWIMIDSLHEAGTQRSSKAKHTLASPTVATRSMSARAQTPPPTSQGANCPEERQQPVPAGIAKLNLRRADGSYSTRPRNISTVVMGRDTISAWYYSPFIMARLGVRRATQEAAEKAYLSKSTPLTIRSSPVALDKSLPAGLSLSSFGVHVCPHCLAPWYCERDATEHLRYCARRPPGREVYRDTLQGAVVFECDGVEERAFCNNLALLARLFLEHKTLDFDMTPFVFYVLCFVSDHGAEVCGYFSKEKRSPEHYNLSCILTLPQYQQRGIGRFLVEMSYEMTRREAKLQPNVVYWGTPEKPLSDLGEAVYHSYWTDAVIEALTVHEQATGSHQITIQSIMATTAIGEADIVWALRKANLIDTNSQSRALRLTAEVVRAHEKRRLGRIAKGGLRFDSHLLSWDPADYVMQGTRVTLPQAVVLTQPLLCHSAEQREGPTPSRKRLRS